MGNQRPPLRQSRDPRLTRDRHPAQMIGDAYFDLRSRLGTALFSLRSLVGEGATGGENAVILGNLVNSLRDPFVFVVVGEVNVGKSTFLNALFGAEFSKTGIMPTTDKIFYFKHGDN